MGKVVPFPAVKEKLKVEKTDIVSNPHDYLVTKTFEFTCPNCKTRAKFDQKNIVFKKLQFYCGGCGFPHTVCNPALKDRK